MATFTVTTDADAGSGSLREAVHMAAETKGADTIIFKATVIRLSGALEISSGHGKITFDGDRDGDGLSDVAIQSGSSHHLTVGAGATVEIRNVDFINGANYAMPSKGVGSAGENGSFAETVKTTDYDGAHGKDGSDGGDATSGARGEDAAGSILNKGELTLVRVGFGDNHAQGGLGAAGGSGGAGGIASYGSEAKSDEVVFFENPPTIPNPDYPNKSWLPYLYVSSDNPAEPAKDGGVGGAGGDGGHGGDGGNGGRGGDAAAAVLNTSTGVVAMQDVVFGGRLTSGIIAGGNEAQGGGGGQGGPGGLGGLAGGGGAGGDCSFTEAHIEPDHKYDADGKLQRVSAASFFEASNGGSGGAGGAGGNAGDAGRNGDGGLAATVLNFGKIEGAAAFSSGESTGGAGGFGPRAAASGGAGGEGGLGGVEYTGYSTYYDPRDPRAIIAKITGNAPSGANGLDGLDGAAGVQGAKGQSGDLVSKGGAASVDRAGSLVYLFGLGQSWDGEGAPQIGFNVIRVGEVTGALTVRWRLVPDGAEPASAADFVSGKLPSGVVKFKAMGADAAYDRTENVAHVTIDIADDALFEAPEGYRIELTSLSSQKAVLGTHEYVGTFVDTTEPIVGADKANKALKGGAFADKIDGRGGNDGLKGLGGADELIGGKGDDTLTGGAGGDKISGGAGKDRFLYEATGDSTKKSFDLITDFGRGDLIDLRKIDANEKTKVDDAFDFVAQKAFAKTPGDLHFTLIDEKGTANDWTIVSGDVDGDRQADFEIHVAGLFKFVESDFLL